MLKFPIGSHPYRTEHRTVHAIQMGLLDSFKKLVGGSSFIERLTAENEATLKLYQERVARINYLENSAEQLQDSELQSKTEAFRTRLMQGETLESLLEEAFAVVREASWRVLRLRHFDVQVQKYI